MLEMSHLELLCREEGSEERGRKSAGNRQKVT